MAGTLGDNSACTIRGLIWALGRETLVIEKPEALKTKGKKCFLELKLISAYEQFEKVLNFIDSFEKSNQNCTSFDADVGWKNGIYAKIFVNGMLEVVRSFSCDLMDIERSLLVEPTGISVESLATAQLMYDTYLLINHIVQQIYDGKLGGCQILDLCHQTVLRSQITTVAKIQILVRCLHKQMLKQIKSWCLYGELNDPFGEFFIKASPPPPVAVETCRKDSIAHQRSFEVSLLSNFDSSLMESTSASLPFTVTDQQHTAEDIDKYYWIDTAYLPSHIPYSLIHKIFSLGKFIIQIKHNPSNKTPVSLMTMNLSDYGIEKSVVRSMMRELEDGAVFHHHMLQNVIDFIWCQTNKYMKRVVEEEGELLTHHRNITDVFLMGRGELIRHFLDKASHLLLNDDASKVHSRSLDLALERVAQDLYGTDNINFLKRFQFSLPPKGDTPPGRTVLSLMKLTYKSPWPLPLIYSQEVQQTYNSVFIFLLNLKRAHRALTQAWNDTTHIHHLDVRRWCNELLFRLTLLVTNLQSYIFVDVILSETHHFQQIVQASHSFEEIMKAHASFLSNIVMRLFLPSDSDKLILGNQSGSVEFRNNVACVHKEIMNLFSLIHEFCLAVRIFGLDPAGGCGKLNDINVKFDSLVVGLISLVKRTNEKYCSEYICTLIMRLDYNDYYTNQYDI